jgi:TrmH family RNA methyltransferase
VGTIWRTADAAGFGGLMLSEACADPYSPKVQRAAMGSGFRVPVLIEKNLPDRLSALKEIGYAVLAADVNGDSIYAYSPASRRVALIIGSEAHGISVEAGALADCRLSLPMRGGTESLNAAVAAGIMMYELVRAYEKR